MNNVWHSYHIPSMPHYMRRPKNAIYINPSNSLKHEIKKMEICYEFRQAGIDFITEAVPNDRDNRRVDIVNLKTGDEIEIETNPKINKEGALTIHI